MGLLDVLGLRRFPKSVSTVQRELFEAVRRGDGRVLVQPVNKYDAIIRHEFKAWMTRALDLCRKGGDAEGVAVYERNLAQIRGAA